MFFQGYLLPGTLPDLLTVGSPVLAYYPDRLIPPSFGFIKSVDESTAFVYLSDGGVDFPLTSLYLNLRFPVGSANAIQWLLKSDFAVSLGAYSGVSSIEFDRLVRMAARGAYFPEHDQKTARDLVVSAYRHFYGQLTLDPLVTHA